jgi:hypothetical protein
MRLVHFALDMLVGIVFALIALVPYIIMTNTVNAIETSELNDGQAAGFYLVAVTLSCMSVAANVAGVILLAMWIL